MKAHISWNLNITSCHLHSSSSTANGRKELLRAGEQKKKEGKKEEMHQQKGGETSWRVDEKWRGRKIKRQVENGRHLYTRWKDKGVKETQAQYGRWYINVQFHCWVNEAMQTLKSRRMLIRPPGQMFLLKNQTVKLTHKTKQSHVCAAFTLQSTFLSYPLLFFCFFFPSLSQEDKGALSQPEGRAGLDMAKGNLTGPCLRSPLG